MDTVGKAKDADIKHLLGRGVAEVIVEEEMVELLRSGKKLRLKEGLDPSAPDIHVGHAVVLRKLRQFQEMGHQVVLIVGDWTAQIGDPSGASVTRPMLSAEQVKENANTYMEQFFKIVDKDKTEVRWQSEWFGKFDLADVISLTSKFTVAQLLARDDFSSRYSAQRPIAIAELLYPLMQAYDSVAMQADVEFGGTDQKFNLLVGRELQSMMGQKPQQIFTTPLLVGTDGVQKMSKSLGNYIGVAEPPDEIYGKTMSINDDLILPYFELVTDVPDEELAEFRRQLENNAVNPMVLKKRLARELVTQFYDEKAAIEAEENFSRVVQQKEVPEDVPTINITGDNVTGEHPDIRRLLVENNVVGSISEAVRLKNQSGIRIDDEKINDFNPLIKDGSILQVGKRKQYKIKIVPPTIPGVGEIKEGTD